MRYYHWFCDNVHKRGNLWHIKVPINSFNGVWCQECKPIPDWDERLIATYPDTEFVHLDFQPCAWPVFSGQLSTFIQEKAPATIQFLPFRLQRPDGTGEVTGYYLGQILNCVDCIDKERTTVADGKWKRSASGAYNIRGQVSLSRKLIGEEPIFRIDGHRVKLVIRQDVKEAIEQAGFTGSRFSELPVSD